MSKLNQSMWEAWAARARQHLAFIQCAAQAPALFKPDAVEQARRDYAHALREMDRWSA